jgi:hypothetical protein
VFEAMHVLLKSNAYTTSPCNIIPSGSVALGLGARPGLTN